MKELIGTGVALVTPFKNDLSVDYDALKNIVNFNIENGEKRLAFVSISPMCFRTTLIPGHRSFHNLVIFFVVIAAIIAR